MAKIEVTKVISGKPWVKTCYDFPIVESEYHTHRQRLTRALKNVENYATLLESYYSYFDSFFSISVRDFSSGRGLEEGSLYASQYRVKLNAASTSFFNLAKLYSDSYHHERDQRCLCVEVTSNENLRSEAKKFKDKIMAQEPSFLLLATEIRNYLQHAGLPIEIIKANAEWNKGMSMLNYNMSASFKRDSLLVNTYFKGPKSAQRVKKFQENFNDEIDLTFAINSTLEVITTLYLDSILKTEQIVSESEAYFNNLQKSRDDLLVSIPVVDKTQILHRIIVNDNEVSVDISWFKPYHYLKNKVTNKAYSKINYGLDYQVSISDKTGI
ncbi:hypothetical protein [Shewanella subflava]|uniref:DUF2971 domain-containing protein n=1 Tax=Shewanella subflava TaxID=2986476 RepID=A0ABT3ID08_9GAMM|nr:hypothetical protein [Shewanella subflava]MCW3173935.1 hypothetical protein [Shewanella subflava]